MRTLSENIDNTRRIADVYLRGAKLDRAAMRASFTANKIVALTIFVVGDFAEIIHRSHGDVNKRYYVGSGAPWKCTA